MGQPYTTQAEVDAAYASGVNSFRIQRAAFPNFQPREGWRAREIDLAPNELLVVNRSRERTIVP
ncbi:MAG TPA: hypothetical protein VH054_03870 [Polyangiaceae bacterium]|jgi:hypothetical protein|nr:hypothetical protein [Polyangiaceae bacterium]